MTTMTVLTKRLFLTLAERALQNSRSDFAMELTFIKQNLLHNHTPRVFEQGPLTRLISWATPVPQVTPKFMVAAEPCFLISTTNGSFCKKAASTGSKETWAFSSRKAKAVFSTLRQCKPTKT